MKRKILLVDGYNMTAFWRETRPFFHRGELDAARTILLQKLSNYASFEGLEVICVFDAQYMPGVRQTYEEFNVTVVFTEEEETADDYIERLAAELNTPKNQVSVATSDLNEQWTVFAQGALRVSARELEKRVAVTKSDLNKLSGQINLQRPPLRPMDSQSLRDLQKMMEKKMTFKILTDSTADLPERWTQENDVQVLGLTIQLDGQTYETVGAGKLTSQELLDKMESGSKPTTSQINVGQFEDVFRSYAKEETPVLYVAFASALSGTYQSAVMAREIVLEDFPDALIRIIDTKAASMGEGLLVMKAAEARAAGQTLEQTADLIESLVPKVKTYFLVDDLNHLMRGGRISKTAALMGSLVNIKPIIAVKGDGTLDSVAKVRGKKKAQAEVVRMTLEGVADPRVVIAYAGAKEVAESLKAQLLESDQVEEVLVMPLGPVISTHTGPGTLGLFSIAQDIQD